MSSTPGTEPSGRHPLAGFGGQALPPSLPETQDALVGLLLVEAEARGLKFADLVEKARQARASLDAAQAEQIARDNRVREERAKQARDAAIAKLRPLEPCLGVEAAPGYRVRFDLEHGNCVATCGRCNSDRIMDLAGNLGRLMDGPSHTVWFRLSHSCTDPDQHITVQVISGLSGVWLDPTALARLVSGEKNVAPGPMSQLGRAEKPLY